MSVNFEHAAVVFSGRTDLWWLRLLRPGFRHCFLALEGAEDWLVIDPLSHRTALAHIPKMQDFCLLNWYRRNGLKVVKVRIDTSKRRACPVMICSCVESVKRILGIHARWVLTPWQLYRYLNKTRKYVLTDEEK
jgi:hypothetical protein